MKVKVLLCHHGFIDILKRNKYKSYQAVTCLKPQVCQLSSVLLIKQTKSSGATSKAYTAL